MKVHNLNNNYLKSLGPTAAETQAMMKADQKRKEIKLDSEATEKIREFQDQVSGTKRKLKDNSGSGSKWAGAEKKPGKEAGEPKEEDAKPEDSPPRASAAHIDIKI